MAEGRRSRKARRDRGGASLPRPRRDEGESSETSATSSDETERRLGRWFALGVPSVGVAAALLVASVGGPGPSLLVLAGTALLGTIGFFWASLRTLSGDAPLPEGMLATTLWSRAAPPEKKREVLRALKDLELEHSMGKIDDEDFRELSARYRETAKALMRAMDAGLAPRRERAVALVEAYLEKRGLDGASPPEKATDDAVNRPAPAAPERVPCASCGTQNELDAAFCKKCGASLAVPVATEKVNATT